MKLSKSAAASNERLVIVGAGMASARLLERLKQLGYRGRITLIGDEPQLNYNRILLSSLLANEKSLHDLPLLSADWHARNAVTVVGGMAAVRLDLAARSVELESGERLVFDKLVLATGSRALIPALSNVGLTGVMGFRNQADVAAMQSAAQSAQSAIVVGGGLLGLEAAHGLNLLGVEVTLVHRNAWLMNRQLDQSSGAMLEAELNTRGIHTRLNASVSDIHGARAVQAVTLDNGARLPADLLIFAAGIVPNKTLAEGSDIRVQRAICADAQLQTSVPNVYAIGECCEIDQRCFGMVAPVWDQADVLASQLCGHTDVTYRERSLSTRLKVSGIELFSAGEVELSSGTELIQILDPVYAVNRRFLVRQGRLVGATLLGDASGAAWYADLIERGADISAFRSHLAFGPDYCADAEFAAA